MKYFEYECFNKECKNHRVLVFGRQWFEFCFTLENFDDCPDKIILKDKEVSK